MKQWKDGKNLMYLIRVSNLMFQELRFSFFNFSKFKVDLKQCRAVFHLFFSSAYSSPGYVSFFRHKSS